MKARIIMQFGSEKYAYGIYPFNTDQEKNRVNEIAQKVEIERGCDCSVEEAEE